MAIGNMQLIQGLAGAKYPVGNVQSSADLSLQQGAQQAPAQAGPQLAQQLGGQVAQLQAQKSLQNVATRADQLQAVGQQGLQANQANLSSTNQQLQTGAQAQQNQQVQQLGQISQSAKQQLYDARLQFGKDQAGLKFSNDMQLTDFMAMTAKSQAEFQNYQSNLQLAYDRKQQVLDSAYKKLSSEMQYQSQLSNQLQDQIQSGSIEKNQIAQAEQIRQNALNQQVTIQSQLVELQKSIYQARAKAANSQIMGQAIGTIVGGGAGAIVGGPSGGIAGASIGGGLGGMAASQTT